MYMNFGRGQKTLGQMKGIFSQRAHWEVARGTAEQAADYCKKDGCYVEYGILPLVTNRSAVMNKNRIEKAFQDCASTSQFMMANKDLYCRLRQGVKDIYAEKAKEMPKQKPFVCWLAGPTGCGKSRYAREYCGDTEEAMANVSFITNLPWFDQYLDTIVACFDDFRKTSVSFNLFLTYIDRYVRQVPIKGSMTNWNPKVIIITCARTPSQEYTFRDQYKEGQRTVYEDVEQVNRRCDVIREYHAPTHSWIYSKGNPQIEEDMQRAVQEECRPKLHHALPNIYVPQEDRTACA